MKLCTCVWNPSSCFGDTRTRSRTRVRRMPGDPNITVDQPTPQKHRRLSLAFCFVVVVLVLLIAMFVFSRSGAIIDRARPIDVETSAIHSALQSYKARFGAFPSGDSPAVFRALR